MCTLLAKVLSAKTNSVLFFLRFLHLNGSVKRYITVIVIVVHLCSMVYTVDYIMCLH